MSKRAWSAVFVAGLTILLAQGPCVAQELATNPREAPQSATSQEGGERAADRFSVPVRIIEGPAESEAARRSEAEREQRERDDLVAQNRAAEAGARTATLAYWQTVLVLIGTVFLAWNLIETRRSVRVAEKGVTDASAAIAIAAESLRIQRLTSRPFVTPTRYYLGGPWGSPADDGIDVFLYFHMALTNLGDSPAFLTGYAATHVVLRNGSDPDSSLTENIERTSFFDNCSLTKDSTFESGSNYGAFLVPRDTWLDIERNRMGFYVLGYIEYQDIYEKLRQRGFCFEFMPGTDSVETNLAVRSGAGLWYDREVKESREK